MNILMNGPALALDRWQRLALVDAAGATAKVKEGRLWITMEHDSRDIFLAAGDTWTIDRDGLTLVQAEEAATVVLTDPVPRARKWLRHLVGMFGRAGRSSAQRYVPYY